MSPKVLPLLMTLALVGSIACGPSQDDIRRIADEQIATALSRLPTETPVPTSTAQPTATPITLPPSLTPPSTATPQPTATPLVMPATATPQPTATPLVLPPAPTPQPTPTPFRLPPTAAPEPTPTVQPTAVPEPSPEFGDVYIQVSPGVFRIETVLGEGSGWLIDRNLILTNYHHVGLFKKVTVRQRKKNPFVATVVGIDVVRDIALLQVPDFPVLEEPIFPLPMGAVTPADTDTFVMSMGYPNLEIFSDDTVGEATNRIAIFSNIVTLESTSVLNIVIDSPIMPGDTGGPILNAQGRVLGMVRAAQNPQGEGQEAGDGYLGIHIDEIRAVLPQLRAGESRLDSP